MWKQAPENSDEEIIVPLSSDMRIMPWWWAAIGSIGSIFLGAVSWFTVWLIAKNDASLKVEAIKVGLSVAAGVGAAGGLLLSFRKQMHSEYVGQAATFDATQRRITELFTKAVEQLGNSKSAVRLGALYTLDRLGQGNPGQRQTVIDVICAYLRMPYEPPLRYRPQRRFTGSRFWTSSTSDMPQEAESREELLVRMTAQKLLIGHLADPELWLVRQAWWPGVTIDLRGACLVDAKFPGCRIAEADFTGAVFFGETQFFESIFVGPCYFNQAIFEGKVTLDAEFANIAHFQEARFKCEASVVGDFSNDTIFTGACFDVGANFSGSSFKGVTHFRDVIFRRSAIFAKATFGYVSFSGSKFSSPPDFSEVKVSVAPKSWESKSDWPKNWVEAASGEKETNVLVSTKVAKKTIRVGAVHLDV